MCNLRYPRGCSTVARLYEGYLPPSSMQYCRAQAPQALSRVQVPHYQASCSRASLLVVRAQAEGIEEDEGEVDATRLAPSVWGQFQVCIGPCRSTATLWRSRCLDKRSRAF